MIVISVGGVEVLYDFSPDELERLPGCIGRIADPNDERCWDCEFYFDCLTIAAMVAEEKKKRERGGGE